MSQQLICSLLGPDRPGLVRHLADLVAQQDGNWLESRMIRLGGQFSGIVRISVASPESAEHLAAALRAFEEDFEVVVHRDDSAAEISGVLVELAVQGQDRQGIVREVCAALSELGVNVEELHSEVAAAAWSGETLFHLDAILRLPDSLGFDDLQRTIETLSDDLVVDVEAVDETGR